MHKRDSGKTQYRLTPPKALEAVAEVLSFGTTKYSPHSWQRVEMHRYVDALYRHLEAARSGTKTDLESGLLHLAHAATNLLFLLETQLKTDENVMDFYLEAASYAKKDAEKSKTIVEEDEEGNQTIFIGG